VVGVPLRVALAPYLLIAVLALGVGLGAGLGLSEAPVAQTAPSHPATASPLPGSQPETCATFSAPNDIGVRCTQSGFETRVSFKISSHLSKALAECLSKLPTKLLPTGSSGLGAITGMIRACGTNGGGSFSP
jgi:hypothetical protein